MIREILNQVKWAYQRVVRGYDERIFWGFDDYFADTFIPPLKEFCLSKDATYGELNPHRYAVYQDLLKDIKLWEEEDYLDMFHGKGLHRIIKNFADHAGYFWD